MSDWSLVILLADVDGIGAARDLEPYWEQFVICLWNYIYVASAGRLM